MKKLKLQKALLAICLALPITLTKNYAISATEKHIEIIEQQADDKETNAQQKLQEQLEQIANKPTHTAALQYYVDIKKPKKFGEEEYKDFLHYYIKDDTQKYLTLIIQANKNLIQFPNKINLEKTLTSETIYRMLINNITDIINTNNLKDEPQLKNLFKDIPQYFSTLATEPIAELPADEKILKEIFTKVDSDNNSSTIKKVFNGISSTLWSMVGYKTDETNNLTALINDYIKQQDQGQKQTNPEYPSSNILILLDDVAKQLHKEAAAFDDKNADKKQKIEEIAKQIERFYHAYFADNNNNKQTEKEEEKKESELNKSNLSFQSQYTDDIQIVDIKEENKNTKTNEELEINKDEAENKKEIIDTSKKEEIEVKEEEEEEKETNSKRNNSTLNIPLSTISEEKKVDNDKENKEEVESPKGKSKEPEIKAEQDEHKKEGKDTQTENKKSDNTDIEEIKQLINEWQQKKEEINKDKEEKLTQLEKDIKELEQKYDKIVNGDEEDDGDMR